jgi:hypothetical protein
VALAGERSEPVRLVVRDHHACSVQAVNPTAAISRLARAFASKPRSRSGSAVWRTPGAAATGGNVFDMPAFDREEKSRPVGDRAGQFDYPARVAKRRQLKGDSAFTVHTSTTVRS